MEILLEREYCPLCKSYVRVLPNYIRRFKHYDARIIDMVIAGKVTSDTYGFEDYPCEITMHRWKESHKKMLL